MSSALETQTSATENITTTSSGEVLARMTGMVKWFNNKAGFGFITVCDEGTYRGKDIFAHYSGIRLSDTQYKYLVQGEYVDFNLTTSSNGTHEYHATDICGVKGGSIMCETRRNAMPAASPDRTPRPANRSPEKRYRVREDKPEPRQQEDTGFVRVERTRPTRIAAKRAESKA